MNSFASRLGQEFPRRYSVAVTQLSTHLWRRFPSIIDPADRDSCIEHTLRRVADHETKHGEAQDLAGLIWRIFPEVAISLLRRQRYKVPMHFIAHNTLDGLAGDYGENAQAIEDRIYAAQILKSLDERTSDILHLKFFEGWSAKEISKKLKISEANVRQLCHRALELLRREREPESDITSHE